MHRRYTIIALLVAATTAHADTKTPTQELLDKVNGELNWNGGSVPVFGWKAEHTHSIGSDEDASISMGDVEIVNPVVGFSASGTDAWVGGELRQFGDCGGDGNSCGKTLGWMHGLMLWEKDQYGWGPVAWSVGTLGGDDTKAFPRKIVDADAAVKVFESSIGDPKAFVKTISDRKDAVLIGSDKGEKWVGGAKIRATLTKWSFAFTVRDGVQAGLAHGKTLAWIAANVDAKSTKKPKAAAQPYRLLAIYEKTGDTWKLVALMFG